MSNDSTRATAILGEELIHVVEQRFAAYDGSASPEGSNPAPAFDAIRAVSTVGFTGKGLRGTLTFVASAASVAILQREFIERPEPDAWRGTASECANTLCGRLKNRLVSRSILIQMSTPSTSVGTDLCVHEDAAHPIRWVTFIGGGVEATVGIRTDFDDNFVMDDAPTTARALAEGSMLIF